MLELKMTNISVNYGKKEIVKNISCTLKTGAITILVLHDIALATRYSDEFLLLNDGYLIAQGGVEEVIRPEILENIYEVKLDISKSNQGYTTITPISGVEMEG